jgi:hypothetical protein
MLLLVVDLFKLISPKSKRDAPEYALRQLLIENSTSFTLTTMFSAN